MQSWSFARRRWLAILLATSAITLGVPAAIGARSWWQHAQRARVAEHEVAAELQRVRKAGEPITAEEMFAFHRVPSGERDLTHDWAKALAALDVLRPTMKEMEQLPVVGHRPIEELDPAAAKSCLSTTEAYMERVQPQLKAILSLARSPGTARFPIDFREGILRSYPHVDQVRHAVRVLRIRSRICRLRNETPGLEASLVAMLQVTEVLRHEPTLTGQIAPMPA